MTTQDDVRVIQDVFDGLNNNPVARFSYTQEAFDEDIVDGVETFNHVAEQNIPKANKTDYNPTIIDKGVRTQGASIPRMGWNHYIGRLSYNVNKIVQKCVSFFNVYRAALAHNANEYDSSAKYKKGDVCFIIEEINSTQVYTWYQRVSSSPETISNIPPTVILHWVQMQDKTALLKADKVDITPAIKTKIAYNEQGIVTDGENLLASDIPNLDASKIASGILPIERGGTGATQRTGLTGAVRNLFPGNIADEDNKFFAVLTSSWEKTGIMNVDQFVQDILQQIQTTGLPDIQALLDAKAPIANPTFSGLPQVPSKATPVQNWPTRIATEAQVYLVKEAAMLLNGSGNLASLPYCGNYDINTLRTPGFYSGYFVNTPYGNAICDGDDSWYNASDGNCVVVPINNTRTKQFFSPENSPLVFHRTSTSPSAWGPWKTFANTDSPYLSGTPTVDEITNVPLTRPANSNTLNNWGNQIVGMNTLRNALIKNNFPAGMYYTQYPKAGETDYANMFPASEAPATLFGGTWTPVYESEAVYFRTGNEANKGSKRGQQWNPGTKQYEAGVAGIEPDAIKDITAGGIVGRGTGTGAFSTNGLNSIGLVSGSSWYFASDSNISSLVENTFMASRAVPTDDTNHPKNRLFKVWKKNA